MINNYLKREQNKTTVILLHVAIWLLFFSLPLLLRSPFDNRRFPEIMLHPPHFNLYHTLRDLMMVGIFYLNAYLLLPRVINRSRLGNFILFQIIIFLFFALVSFLLFGWLIGFPSENKGILSSDAVNPMEVFSPAMILFRDFFPYMLILASSTSYCLIIDRIRSERLVKERENEDLKTELLLLRSQINPHFLFNILNNLVSLARKHSDQLEPSLIKLSYLMRYMFYEVQADKVPLQRELEYVQSYIDLQEQRFRGTVSVKVNLQQDVDHYVIEPMLLIPFVENAFKHGTTLIESAEIDISLQVINDVLCFFVGNKFNANTNDVKDTTTGIGLINVKKRLDLLYGDHYQLNILKHENWHTVSLQLNLN